MQLETGLGHALFVLQKLQQQADGVLLPGRRPRLLPVLVAPNVALGQGQRVSSMLRCCRLSVCNRPITYVHEQACLELSGSVRQLCMHVKGCALRLEEGQCGRDICPADAAKVGYP